ncbi:MAG TPA: Ig-like domain-containing protein, partial [Geobacteraceae bacterium]|nr:Ig-like domain-containing protein [Geobacteraceae bacterium]
MSRYRFLMIALLMAISLAGCGGGTTPVTLVSLTITPANPSIAPGTSLQFRVAGTFSDGSAQDMTTSAAWSSSNSGVATITTGGLATAVTAGTTTITASVGTLSASTLLTSAALQAIALTPANP